jgi:hypothetical protein
MNAPAITVLMTVYNGLPHLTEAVDSILTQTYRDFELLIINDGSTDDSLARLRAYDDPRIRLIDQQPNQGIRTTYNRGLREARGRYVALMDQDDISRQDRLEQLFALMEAQPALALCGSAIETFGDRPVPPWVRYFESEALKIALLFENPICHPSVMLRRSALESQGLSYPDVPYAEEYALWIALSRSFPIANLPAPLLRYRCHATQVSRSKNTIQSNSIDRLAGLQLDALGLPAGSRDLRIHHALGGGFFPHPSLARLLQDWISILIAANTRTGLYHMPAFATQLACRREQSLTRHRTALHTMPLHRRLRWQLASWRALWRPDRR